MISPTTSAARPKRNRGQALVEFAVVFPILAVIFLGLIDMGRAIFTYNTLAESARQAARLAIVDQTVSDVQGQAMASGATLGLAASNVDVCFKTATTSQQDCSSSTNNCPVLTREIGCLAIVRTHVAYAPMTPVIAIFWNSISLSSTSVASIENVCPAGSVTTCS